MIAPVVNAMPVKESRVSQVVVGVDLPNCFSLDSLVGWAHDEERSSEHYLV